MILKLRISHTFHEISHIFYRISHTLSSHDKRKLLFFFIQQYFSPQPTDIYMQGSIQERLIKPYSPHYLSRIQTVALQWTDHCTLVNSSVYSSKRFYPLEWNEWNVALTGQTHYIFYYILLCYSFVILLFISILPFVYVDCFSYLYKIY